MDNQGNVIFDEPINAIAAIIFKNRTATQTKYQEMELGKSEMFLNTYEAIDKKEIALVPEIEVEYPH